MKKLAIIGCSGMIYDFIYEYSKPLNMNLVAVCGEDSETSRFAAMYTVQNRYLDYRLMLNEQMPDMVIVYPDQENKQFEIVKNCLLAGADVLCERPVCHTREEGEALIQLEKQTGKFIMTRYNRRYMPAYKMVRQILSSSSFGRPLMYSSSFHAGPYSSELTFIENHISHHLDLARMLLGRIHLLRVDRIAENAQQMGFNIVFKSEEGVLGNIQSNSFLCPDYPMERVEIAGNSRQIIVDNVRNVYYNQPQTKIENSQGENFLSEGGTRVWNINQAQLNNHVYYGFEEMLGDFFRLAETGKKPDQGMKETVDTFKLIAELKTLIA